MVLWPTLTVGSRGPVSALSDPVATALATTAVAPASRTVASGSVATLLAIALLATALLVTALSGFARGCFCCRTVC